MSDPTIEEIVLEQRAVNPRVETPPAPVVDVPIVDETIEPVVVEPEPEVPPVKPKKTAEEVLKGRVGHLTKTLSTKDQELEDYRTRLAAAEALLSANPSGETPPVVPATKTPTYTPADFEAAVTAKAEAQEFNRRADDLYNSGAEKFSDWKDAVDGLVVSGFMDKNLLDAAMAVEDGTAVLHYLGTNLDEAERIGALSPIRKAAEMAKLSTTLTAPKIVPVSAAPAPIRPVSGSPSPSIDLQRIADTNDMSEYAAARAKQGSRWARGR